MHDYPGTFIAFEGGEGGGKSTAIKLVADNLRQLGYDVVTTFEPGDTPLGSRLRAILLEHGFDLSEMDEVYLFCIARRAFLNQVVFPALQRGCIVLTDRFELSTFVYQGRARGIDEGLVQRINSEVTGGFHAARTYIFDLPVQIGLSRVSRRGASDRLEAESIAFHERVRAGFLYYGGLLAQNVVIDATQSLDQVVSEITKDLTQFLQSTERQS